MAVFRTTIVKDSEVNATGIQIPEAVIQELGAGKKPKVKLTLNGYTYRTTVAVMGGAYWAPLAAEHREAAGVKANEEVEITIELDTEPRIVTVPDDLAAALAAAAGATAAFEASSYSVRKEYVRQVESAKAPETRARRIAGVVEKLRAKS
ncbi:MAG: DUF1905 domain-containing protein [Anaerolineales bacterium]|nr:DUF1905 domain-containing protein [Anaerolineales bacterium]